jgi:hypothetical protein
LGASHISRRGECQLYGPPAAVGGPWAVTAPRPACMASLSTRGATGQWTGHRIFRRTFPLLSSLLFIFFLKSSLYVPGFPSPRSSRSF